ncbi:hypothetical protein CPB84DRAFT_1845485 [Gymnopilus junonius]|uniref:Uncharacterized protein n=1 Tax=Gymnopilus junonius TaxID=109634 RepID=A0A9P5TQ69_GYMJU|nr:hypothetical protein CPB84DRAFT_1845485 [Gymnopilus junonius]
MGADVGIRFKFIDTDQYITGTSATDIWYAEKEQTVEQLKTDVGSFYPASKVTTAWALKLPPPSNMTLDNYAKVGDYPINDGDYLLFQDPELAKISYSENNGPTKSIWTRRSETILAVKRRAFPGQENNYAFRQNGTTIADTATVGSLVNSTVDNVYLDLIYNARGG